MAEQKHILVGLTVKPFEELSDEEQVQIMGFLSQVRGGAETMAGREFSDLKPTQCGTQLVSGINYFIKASTGDGIFIFLRLYKPFSGEVSLVRIEDNKTAEDQLHYF